MIQHRRVLLLSLLFLFLSNILFCQDLAKKEIEKQAEKNWNNLNYKLAAEQYEKLLSLEAQNLEYAYRFAVSNFLAGFNIDKSLKYIEPLLGKENAPNDVAFWIGKMYMYQYQFNDAIDMFNTFIASSGITSSQIAEAKKQINMCLSAIQLLNKPVNVSFENLGPNINSSANDFLPLIPNTEDLLIFTSDKRFDEASQTFDENIYISYPEKNGWSLSKPLSYLNTFDPEKAVGISPDGKILYVCGHFANSYSDINVAIQKNKQFKFDPLNNVFNTLGNKLTTGASITEDGKTIYFSAVRPDAIGKSDIYVIKILPNGQWSQPKNLGETINTNEDEIYPYISADGKILYFSSQGHNSMGEYDIFVSYFNEITNEWTTPQNLGYPINSPGPDYNIIFSPTKKYAYISAIRKEGLGGLDIYKLIFNDAEAPTTILKASIYTKNHTDSSLWRPNQELLNITIYDKNKNVFGKYLYNYNLNRFVAALPVGNYTLEITATGYNNYIENIEILDRSLYVPEIEKNIILIKK
ncbi:MAG: PD40 domain-containing protein [Bacteroidales bacterium]|nr:PD40 domain-containing protein [Bacteroidales bacterium]